MYHPNKYNEHNRALINLIDKFNKVSQTMGNKVQMYFQEQENFRDDGGVLYVETGEKFLYDFEKRHTYYNDCDGLKFQTLGQFERKIEKEEIKLSIQCSTDEQCLVIAWHEDYKKEDIKNIHSVTENGGKEKKGKRFTEDFVEVPYTRLDLLYLFFLEAFKSRNFNQKCFKLISSPQGKYNKTPVFDVECADLIELATRPKSVFKNIAKEELIRRCCNE